MRLSKTHDSIDAWHELMSVWMYVCESVWVCELGLWVFECMWFGEYVSMSSWVYVCEFLNVCDMVCVCERERERDFVNVCCEWVWVRELRLWVSECVIEWVCVYELLNVCLWVFECVWFGERVIEFMSVCLWGFECVWVVEYMCLRWWVYA
jgi:hypothetical protein